MADRSRGEAIALILHRIDTTLAEDQPGFPHYADPYTGEWTRTVAGDWTGGFWNGLLWLAARHTGVERYRAAARTWSELLLSRVDSDTVFRGFLFWYGAALGDVLCGDKDAADIAVAGARGLRTLYNPAARLIPLGTEAEESSDVGRGEANIDGVPGGTPLLAWAARQTGDDLLRAQALAHAQRHIELCVREDFSVVQSATIDPYTGQVLRQYTHKGIRDDSTWGRAQAWAMLGFAQAMAIDPDRFRGAATGVADWWIAHLPQTAVSRWDFDDTDPQAPTDTSATAIGAAALLKLARLIPDRADRYQSTAERMVDALIDRHLTPVGASDRRPPGILADGCYNNRIGLATRNELIWGDYFLFETLVALSGAIDPVRI